MRQQTIFSIFLLPGFWAVLVFPSEAAPPRTGDGERGRAMEGGVGVARISLIAGDVSARRGPQGDLVSAEYGLPLVGGDYVFTGADSKAEIRFDARNYLRMDARSEVRMHQLGQSAYRLEVTRGSVSYSMLKHGLADVDLRAQGGSLAPSKEGIYRVDVRGAGTAFIVRKGEAAVLTPARNYKLKSNKSLVLSGPAPSAGVKVTGAPQKDPFDEWNKRRDKIIAQNSGMAREPVWYPTAVSVGWGWGSPYLGGWWGMYPRYGYPWRVGVGYRARRW